MPHSDRLYYDDPTLLAFDATVVACEPAGDGYRVALDRTAFYPTSGGQPHDLGHLRAADQCCRSPTSPSTMTSRYGTTSARRLLQARPSAERSTRERRHDFRQQHSGQHILSAAFDHLFEARTESVHLGIEACTLDLHREVTADECRRAEDHANGVVWDNRPVSIRYADAADLVERAAPAQGHGPRRPRAAHRHRRPRPVGLRRHACPTAREKSALIVIRGTERFRGGTRVTFLCGRRALESYRALRDSPDAAARTLSVAPADVPDALLRLREDLKQEQRRATEAVERLTVLQAEALAARRRRVGPARRATARRRCAGAARVGSAARLDCRVASWR